MHQLSSIAWASATQQDPEAALVAVAGLHTLLAHWAKEHTPTSEPADPGDLLPVVYPDTTVEEVLSSLAGVVVASVVVASGHAGQYQPCAQVLQVFAMALPRLSPEHQLLPVAQLHRVLPTVATHTFTVELARALAALRQALDQAGFGSCATQLSGVESRLAGQLTGAEQHN